VCGHFCCGKNRDLILPKGYPYNGGFNQLYIRQRKLKIWVELAQACKPKGREVHLA
jgi:hypothetical protein